MGYAALRGAAYASLLHLIAEVTHPNSMLLLELVVGTDPSDITRDVVVPSYGCLLHLLADAIHHFAVVRHLEKWKCMECATWKIGRRDLLRINHGKKRYRLI